MFNDPFEFKEGVEHPAFKKARAFFSPPGSLPHFFYYL